MPRAVTAVAATVVAVAAVAACSSSGSGGSAGPTSAAPSTAAATTAPPATSAPATAEATTAAPSVTATASAAAASAPWAAYHADDSRTGAVATGVTLSSSTPAWTAKLGNAVYGQPVVGLGKVFAGTEGDKLVALDEATGKTLWTATVGTPLTNVASTAGCGNIDPLGITGTPALDATSGTVYAVGETSSGGTVHHRLIGVDAATGKVRVNEDVDPPLPSGESAAQLLQRPGLAIANGRVYVSFGGNFGDCGHYHGWVVSVAETGAAQEQSFEVASDGEGGAVWMSGGAPAVDSSGNVYVTTGNANPDPPEGGPDPKAYTESVVKLSPALKPLASFKDKVAGGDEDLSTSNPVLLPGGLLFATGKTQIGFLLKQSDLSQVAAIHGLCGSNPDGGPAYDAATQQLFVPCNGGGIQVVDVGRKALGSKLSGANSSPTIAGRDVWAADYDNGTLTEYAVAGGAQVKQLSTGSLPHFATPSVGDGLLLLGTDTGVTAWR